MIKTLPKVKKKSSKPAGSDAVDKGKKGNLKRHSKPEKKKAERKCSPQRKSGAVADAWLQRSLLRTKKLVR